MHNFIGRRWWWLVIWLILQAGGILGIALNWEATPAYRLWSGIALAGMGLVSAAILLVPEEWVPRRALSPAWMLPVAVGILILWALPLEPEFPLDALRWLLTTLAAGWLALLVRRPASHAAWRWGYVALMIALLLFSLATLMVYPRIYTDEGLNLNHALTSAHVGPIYKINLYLGVFGDPQRIDAEVFWWPVGLLLELIGLGLWQGRFVLWLFLPFTIGLIYRATYRLYHSQKAGITAALFFAASTLTLYSAHFIRQEIALCFVLALALLLHAHLEARTAGYRPPASAQINQSLAKYVARRFVEEKPRFIPAFLLGAVVSLAIDVHPNAFVFCFGFGALYTGLFLGEAIRRRSLFYDARLVGLMVGGGVGVLSYFLLHVVSDPADFMAQVSHHYHYFGTTHSADNSLLETIVLRLMTAVNHVRSYYAFSLVEGSLISLALIAGLLFFHKAPAHMGVSASSFRAGTGEPITRSAGFRQKVGRRLAFLFLLCLGGWLVMGSSPVPIYAAILLPLAAVLVGGLLTHLPAAATKWVVTLVILAAMVGGAIRVVTLAEREGFNQQFMTCLDALSEQLPPDAMIFGEHLFWLARPDLSDRYAARTLVEWPMPPRTAAEWWDWIDPDIVLWPGPIDAVGYAYVTEHGFTYHELPECPTSELMIWLKPGVELRGDGG